MRSLAAVLALVVAAPLAAQNPVFANKRVPFEPGFRVFIVPDMEGMASVVFNREIIAGVEGERYRNQSVISHTYAFDTLSVNGMVLNEVGINALMAGEVGVSVSLVSGDDVVVEEAKRILGSDLIGVVAKTAVGRSAAIAWSPARVREMLQRAAREAIEREMRGDFKPFTLQKPYR
ncbi:MAG: M55 family metallopeptidase, partial [Longimicrobiales bacterium]